MLTHTQHTHTHAGLLCVILTKAMLRTITHYLEQRFRKNVFISLIEGCVCNSITVEMSD